jgi:hypothetical protein
MKIISNYHKRPLLYWWDLSDKEKLEFDWITDNDDNDPNDFTFFRYKDWVYCLSEFLRYPSIWGSLPEVFKDWDSYISDTFFSGILIKFPDPDNWDTDNGIIVGWYYS